VNVVECVNCANPITLVGRRWMHNTRSTTCTRARPESAPVALVDLGPAELDAIALAEFADVSSAAALAVIAGLDKL
jgi:hypothetical protein